MVANVIWGIDFRAKDTSNLGSIPADMLVLFADLHKVINDCGGQLDVYPKAFATSEEFIAPPTDCA